MLNKSIHDVKPFHHICYLINSCTFLVDSDVCLAVNLSICKGDKSVHFPKLSFAGGVGTILNEHGKFDARLS